MATRLITRFLPAALIVGGFALCAAADFYDRAIPDPAGRDQLTWRSRPSQ